MILHDILRINFTKTPKRGAFDYFAGGRADPFLLGEELVKVTRGFGFWCWKPQIILQSLAQIEPGSILLYADIGCEFIKSGAATLVSKLKALAKHDIMVVSHCEKLEKASNMSFREKIWTKNDIFKHFGVENSPQITDTCQICATAIFMKNTANTRKIITLWLNTMKNHFDLIDDSPSKSPNFKDFRRNCHDQSLFSVIAKMHGLKTLILSHSLYYEGEKFGLKFSGKSRFSMSQLISQAKCRESLFSATKKWLKLGGKVLLSKKARRQCRNLGKNDGFFALNDIVKYADFKL